MKGTMTSDVDGRISTNNRTTSPSITEIIQRFQRIKEGRFKPKDNAHSKDINSLTARFQRHGEPVRDSERPSSGTQKMRDMLKKSVEPVRRRSLPTILKPETPPPLEEDWIDSSASKRLQERSRILARRYSTSHVAHMQYSKQDIKHLLREHRRCSVGEMKPVVAKATEEEEEEWRRWLTGEELHDYYNMWEWRQRSRLRQPRRLAPLHHSHVTNFGDTSSERPRLNTY